MKKILKSWITWAIVAVACFATAYFINANQAPVEPVEVVAPDTTVVAPDTTVVAPAADSLVVDMNTVSTTTEE